MPTYIYKCDSCKEEKTIIKPMSKYREPELCPVCQFVMYRDYNAEHKGGGGDTPGNYPMVSSAAGVGASQSEEAMAHADKIGVPTEFNNDGDAVFRDKAHRKEYCEAIGLFDRNASPYSDPQPKNK